METWTSYSLTDFLLFAPDTYFRLFERANAEFWPGHLVIAGAALWLLILLLDPARRSGGIVALLLAAVWALVAGVFFAHYYAQINPAAQWFAVGFGVQTVLLVLAAAVDTRHPLAQHGAESGFRIGLSLYFIALFIHPLAGLVAGRPWQGVEVFGIAPDPTALGTLGVVLMWKRNLVWLLVPIPLLWCAISAVTYIAMDIVSGTLPFLIAAAAILAVKLGHWNSDGQRSA